MNISKKTSMVMIGLLVFQQACLANPKPTKAYAPPPTIYQFTEIDFLKDFIHEARARGMRITDRTPCVKIPSTKNRMCVYSFAGASFNEGFLSSCSFSIFEDEEGRISYVKTSTKFSSKILQNHGLFEINNTIAIPIILKTLFVNGMDISFFKEQFPIDLRNMLKEPENVFVKHYRFKQTERTRKNEAPTTLLLRIKIARDKGNLEIQGEFMSEKDSEMYID